MGDHYSSVLQWVGFVIMYKSLIASCLAVATLASPEAEADAGILVAPAVHTNALVGSGGISPAWPATRALGLDSTCYGCRPLVAAVHVVGKRSAEAEADPYYGYGYLAAPLYRYRYGPGIALHPGVATSFVARSPQGLGKRSADAEPGVVVGHAVGLGLNNIHGLSHFGSGYGISQLHPSGHSFQHTSRLHKREAEAEPEADAYYGYYGHGYGLGYGHGYGHALGYHGLGYSHGGYYGHGYGHGYGYGYYG